MIRMYFGSPGCGKSTLLAKIALFERKRYNYIFTNGDCSLCSPMDMQKLENYTVPPNSLLLIDEAGIEFNNRDFKRFGKGKIEFFKKYRHEECDIFLFSQSWEDVDLTIKRLVDEIYYLSKVGPFTIVRRVYKRVGTDEKEEQIIDKYKFGKLFGNLIGHKNFGFVFRPLYYKYFDSYEKLDRSYIPVVDPLYSPSKWEYRLKYFGMKWGRKILLAVIILLLVVL